jgi:hypothetical protein
MVLGLLALGPSIGRSYGLALGYPAAKHPVRHPSGFGRSRAFELMVVLLGEAFRVPRHLALFPFIIVLVASTLDVTLVVITVHRAVNVLVIPLIKRLMLVRVIATLLD